MRQQNEEIIRIISDIFESQFFPNGINYGDKYILPILKKRRNNESLYTL